jgi:hypothetical protein
MIVGQPAAVRDGDDDDGNMPSWGNVVHQQTAPATVMWHCVRMTLGQLQPCAAITLTTTN